MAPQHFHVRFRHPPSLLLLDWANRGRAVGEPGLRTTCGGGRVLIVLALESSILHRLITPRQPNPNSSATKPRARSRCGTVDRSVVFTEARPMHVGRFCGSLVLPSARSESRVEHATPPCFGYEPPPHRARSDLVYLF
ncbi:hypothetical protein BHE74_00055374 [Ensete ventricosum]|nr:hypothetical protein GW17_00021004 [Ensete ventricosum]RWW39307.1 hypothetical protein BHE74_00055374 [Ensete ventricosum]RZS26271.1 hypothetical protein BHM03_00059593 [Ensete ventricosum]